jgi:16S rRNA (cytidine1402-2'-O)-methyltransferase
MWADALGNRRVVVARELTKRHQELWRGTLEELAGAPREWKGEITVVIEGHRRLIVE